MVLDFVLKAVFSAVDLLKGAFLLSVIAFVAVFVASFFHARLSKKYKLSWLNATMITSYLAVFLLIMLLYSAPVVLGFLESDQGVLPQEFQMSALDWAMFVFGILARNAAVSLLLAFFILPLAFLSSMVFDYLKEKFKGNDWIKVFAAVFVSSLAVSIICIFLLPWIVPGLLYLVFYWHM